MKRSLATLALLGTCAAAQAQSALAIYGAIDAGISKKTDGALVLGKRDANKLGVKGQEDLGSGLKALFQLEIRYEPDTGAIENTSATTSRPLFQGQSRVGLQGGFGTVRLGRGLTALQDSIAAFEPWSGIPSMAGFQTDLQLAGYTPAFGSGSTPLDPVGNSGNRISNALFYNTPVLHGVQFNATIATKEGNNGPAIVGIGTLDHPQFAANAQGAADPYSLSATYNGGPLALMGAYERNAVETTLWSVAASVYPVPDLKLMVSYQKQDQSFTKLSNPETRSWIVGANYTLGPGKILVGYGQKMPDGIVKTRQASLGYEYSLSVRTYLYVDASNRKQPSLLSPLLDSSINFFGIGMHHNF